MKKSDHFEPRLRQQTLGPDRFGRLALAEADSEADAAAEQITASSAKELVCITGVRTHSFDRAPECLRVTFYGIGSLRLALRAQRPQPAASAGAVVSYSENVKQPSQCCVASDAELLKYLAGWFPAPPLTDR